MILALALLTWVVLVGVCYPSWRRSGDFNEKSDARDREKDGEKEEIIRSYRVEVKYIKEQHQKQLIDDKTCEQLLLELDRQSAAAMLATEQHDFTYQRRLVPVGVVVGAVLASVWLYAYFYQKQGVGHWQHAGSKLHSAVANGLFDEASLRGLIAQQDDKTAKTYCFLLQQRLLKQYVDNPAALAHVAQCHLSQGAPLLAQQAIHLALQRQPEHAASLYVLAELEFLQFQQLSASTHSKLASIAANKPSAAVEIRYLLLLNSYAQGDIKQAKVYAIALRAQVDDSHYPQLQESLNFIEPQIDAQLYMIEGAK